MYILSNKENILNCNDISIAHNKNDPMGKLFNVKHFQKNQAHQLIQPHIVYQDNCNTVGGLEIGRLKSTNISGPQSDSALLFFLWLRMPFI